jgi:hypothetical protein
VLQFDCASVEATDTGELSLAATGDGSVNDGDRIGSDSRGGSIGSDRTGSEGARLKGLGVSFEKVVGCANLNGSSDTSAVVGCGRSDVLLVPVSSIDPLTSLESKGLADGNGSGCADSNSLTSCSLVPSSDSGAGELDDELPASNFHGPPNRVFHENAASGEESAAGGVETSGS